MAKKKSKKKSNQDILNELTEQKISLLHDLAVLIAEYNGLAKDGFSAEDWLFGLPIESVKELRAGWVGDDNSLKKSEKRRTRLGDLKIRSVLKKKSAELESKIQQIDTEIKNIRVLLLEEQIEQVLNPK